MNGKSSKVEDHREGMSPAESIPDIDFMKCLRELV